MEPFNVQHRLFASFIFKSNFVCIPSVSVVRFVGFNFFFFSIKHACVAATSRNSEIAAANFVLLLLYTHTSLSDTSSIFECILSGRSCVAAAAEFDRFFFGFLLREKQKHSNSNSAHFETNFIYRK